MLDFMRVMAKTKKHDGVEQTVLRPVFTVKASHDLLIAGGDFKAIYDAKSGYWKTSLEDAAALIDRDTKEYAEDTYGSDYESLIYIERAVDYSTNIMVDFMNYIKKTRSDSNPSDNVLNRRILFANDEPVREDHATFKLPYTLSHAEPKGWNELIGTLYSTFERQKLEWFIGGIASNEFLKIDKFAALHGRPGTGKSTVFDILEGMFAGYWDIIDMEALASPIGSSFSSASLESNPIVGIQDDGDLRHLSGNTLINSISSHKNIIIKQKFKKEYSISPRTVMFVGTNYDVRIEGDDAGIYRRLINIETSDCQIPYSRYMELMHTVIPSEYGAIVQHCIDVYNELGGANAYHTYRADAMRLTTDIIASFLLDNDDFLIANDPITLGTLWRAFKEFADDANYKNFKMRRAEFKEKMRLYYREYSDRGYANGVQYRSLYTGYNRLKINPDMAVMADGESIPFYNLPRSMQQKPDVDPVKIDEKRLNLTETTSILDNILRDCPAQYANKDDAPTKAWSKVTTTLGDLDTGRLHYVRPPENHIVIDLDLKNEDGGKDAILNLTKAATFPDTYTEFSKGGSGVHLHYIYDGDPTMLERIIEPNVEVKVFTGKASLRRRLTLCNNHEIAHLAGGYLPLRKEKPSMVNKVVFKNEKHLRSTILKIMDEKSGGGTAPAVTLIGKILNDAYEQGLSYDMTDLRADVENFACTSTHHAKEAYKEALGFKWQSADMEKPAEEPYEDDRLVFFDIEVFPNLFLVNWKYQDKGEWHWNKDHTEWIFDGKRSECTRMINPTAMEIEKLSRYKLVGFNNLRYDNLLLYARMMGYTVEELYEMSNNIINGNGRKNYTFREASHLSYTDIYDFASAGHKQSLKKFEIKLGLHHDELEYPWDQPVPENEWTRVAEYCDNDVLSTEAVFAYLKGDYEAREMLAAITGLTVNDTTNTLTKAFIFGDNKKPDLVYTDLKTGYSSYADGREVKCPYPNAFAGYEYRDGKNYYHRANGDVIDLGRGGYVAANPGMYGAALTLDVASMHPHSAIAMNIFGEYTQRFIDIVTARMLIKHGDYDKAKKLFNGALAPYLTNKDDASAVAAALKTAINAVYGQTAAPFENPFKDPRNVNNIVALRGALFMAQLQDEVEAKGFTVIHIKTDSIKIANPTKDILDYCCERAKHYGYTFETEAIWDRICLVNKAVIIGHQTSDSPQAPGEWVAVGKQFQRPYIFKTLFSHENVTFEDCCEVKEVKSPYSIHIRADDGTTRYIGRNGAFTPVKSTLKGSGELVKPKKNGAEGWDAVAETKGFKWIESETIRSLRNRMDYVDHSYYTALANKAVADISKFGDFDEFVDLSPKPAVPFLMPCGEPGIEDCSQCPHYNSEHELCQLGFDISDVLLKTLNK